MKSLIRNTIVNSLSLLALTQLLAGVKIEGGTLTYLIGGIALSLMIFLLKPLLNLLALPLNFITFGTFSFFINVIILYLLTVAIPQITISAFTFKGESFMGFVIPKISVNAFFAYIISSAVLSFVASLVNWLIKK
ncbi:MAG: phage holin family protein [Patescibacteria group bacterium]|nr:phage holin family protein [Patescibacteria group bacterium]